MQKWWCQESLYEVLRVKKRVLLMEQDGLLGLNQDVQTKCHENNKEREVF